MAHHVGVRGSHPRAADHRPLLDDRRRVDRRAAGGTTQAGWIRLASVRDRVHRRHRRPAGTGLRGVRGRTTYRRAGRASRTDQLSLRLLAGHTSARSVVPTRARFGTCGGQRLRCSTAPTLRSGEPGPRCPARRCRAGCARRLPRMTRGLSWLPRRGDEPLSRARRVAVGHGLTDYGMPLQAAERRCAAWELEAAGRGLAKDRGYWEVDEAWIAEKRKARRPAGASGRAVATTRRPRPLGRRPQTAPGTTPAPLCCRPLARVRQTQVRTRRPRRRR